MTQTGFEKGQLYEVPLSDLHVDPAQPRKYFDEEALKELTASVAKHGVLDPVLVRFGEEGELLLVSGERRYQAALQAGLTAIPALLTDGDPAEIAIVENLLRENLTAIEEAEAIAQLRDSHAYRLCDLSQVLGKAESTLCDMLALTKLPEEIKEECRNDPKATRGALVIIAKQGSAAKMIAMYKRLKANGMTRGELREAVRVKGTQTVDRGFIKRFTQRMETLQPGSLDHEEGRSLAADLEALRSVLNKKLKVLKARPLPAE